MTDTTPEAVERLARVLDGPFYRVEGYGGPYIDEATLRDEHTAAAATLRAQQAQIAAMRARDDTFARLLRQARAEGMRMAAQVAVDFDGGAETDPGGWPGRIAAAILAAAEQEEQEK